MPENNAKSVTEQEIPGLAGQTVQRAQVGNQREMSETGWKSVSEAWKPVGIVAGVCVLLACFLPFMSMYASVIVFSATESIFLVDVQPMLALLLIVLGIALIVFSARRKRVPLMAAGAFCAILTIFVLIYIHTKAAEIMNFLMGAGGLQPGPGWVLAIAAIIACFAAAIIAGTGSRNGAWRHS